MNACLHRSYLAQTSNSMTWVLRWVPDAGIMNVDIDLSLHLRQGHGA